MGSFFCVNIKPWVRTFRSQSFYSLKLVFRTFLLICFSRLLKGFPTIATITNANAIFFSHALSSKKTWNNSFLVVFLSASNLRLYFWFMADGSPRNFLQLFRQPKPKATTMEINICGSFLSAGNVLYRVLLIFQKF